MKESSTNISPVSNKKSATTILGYAISCWLVTFLFAFRGSHLPVKKMRLHINFLICALALTFAIIVTHSERVCKVLTN